MSTIYNYTGGLITEGLVLNLDAAKRDSYPGSGTLWKDLSGNGNNGTLTNGPTYTGVSKDASIIFDGVDDYVQIPYNIGNSNVDYTINISFIINSFGTHFNGNVSSFQSYNKALSAQEVLQNYNTTKTRFGL
jgi:hypothetical protein